MLKTEPSKRQTLTYLKRIEKDYGNDPKILLLTNKLEEKIKYDKRDNIETVS